MKLHYNTTTQTLFSDGMPLGKLKALVDYDKDAAVIIACFVEEKFEGNYILDPLPPRHGRSDTELHRARVRRACEMLNRYLKNTDIRFRYSQEEQTINIS